MRVWSTSLAQCSGSQTWFYKWLSTSGGEASVSHIRGGVLMSVMAWIPRHMHRASLELVKCLLIFFVYCLFANFMPRERLILAVLSDFGLKAAFPVFSCLCPSAVNHGFWLGA